MKKSIIMMIFIVIYSITLISGCASTFVRVQQIYSSDLNGKSFPDFVVSFITDKFSYNWEIVEDDDFNRNKEYIDIKEECMEELEDRITLNQSSIGKVFYMTVTRGEERYYAFIIINEGYYNVRTKELTSFSYRIIIIKLK
jgi:hypothetical protein